MYITAEIGSHWMGDYGVLEQLCKLCKVGGIDAVKFQALSVEKICRHPELEYYESSSVTPDNIEQINDICSHFGLEWYASVTYPEAVEFLDPFVNKFNIPERYSDNDKIKDACFGTGKTVIISTQKPFKHDSGRVKNLLCVPKYPTDYHEINFQQLKRFDGYSNHCPNALAVLTAAKYGADFIEFHITPNKTIFLLDNIVSFSPVETLDLMRWLRPEGRNNNPGKANEPEIPKQGFSTSQR